MRIWKSNASEKIGPVSTKERQAIEYRKALIDRWATVKDVRSIKDRRHVPESIHKSNKIKSDMVEARKVKEDRRRKHTRAGQEKPKAERKSELVQGDWVGRANVFRDRSQGAKVELPRCSGFSMYYITHVCHAQYAVDMCAISLSCPRAVLSKL